MLDKHLLQPHRRRDYLCQHFVAHFQAELAAYTDGGRCKLCQLAFRTASLLRHVGKVHGILYKLVPPAVRPFLIKRRRRQQVALRRAAEPSSSSVVVDLMGHEVEEIVVKMELDDSLQVGFLLILIRIRLQDFARTEQTFKEIMTKNMSSCSNNKH